MKPTPNLPQPDTEPRTTEPLAALSALADGDAGELEQACRSWRDDAGARRAWHTYHLIGDVMRSEELARPAARDAAFLAALRERMAAEPVLLAPTPPAATPRRGQAWLLPAAAAAGFMVVAGVLVVTRVSQPGVTQADVVAAAPAIAVRSAASVPRTQMVRDVRLDELMRLHQFAAGGVGVGAPGGHLRRVEMTVPAEPAR